MAKKVLIFFPHRLQQRHGGPYSMLYHLQEALRPFPNNVQFLSSLVSFPPERIHQPYKASVVKRILKNFLPKKWIYTRRIKRWLKEVSEPEMSIVKTVDVSVYDVLHFHETIDLWRYRSWIENFKGSIVLTSHSPKPYHLELLEDVMDVVKESLATTAYNLIASIDSFAYSKAHHLVFPCAEAMESYYQLWPAFSNTVKHKNIVFLTTGVLPSVYNNSGVDVRAEFAIPPHAFVITFIGRRLAVKGFDLLVDAAKHLLELYPDLYFFIVGKKSSEPALNNKQWIETGWTEDPFSFVQAGDLHVVPNRHTNFDLNVLEVLSLGKPMLLSDTGGNKFFKQFKSPGLCYHHPSVQDLVDKIKAHYANRSSMAANGEHNMGLYQAHFTARRMAADHLQFYASV